MFFTPAIRRAAYQPSLRSLDRNFERFFHEAAFTPVPQTGIRGYSVDQSDSAYTLSIEVPGLSKEQLSIGIEGAVVRIESLADAPRSVKAAYELPQEIDASASSAKLENGVLALTLVKKAPVSKIVPVTIN